MDRRTYIKLSSVTAAGLGLAGCTGGGGSGESSGDGESGSGGSSDGESGSDGSSGDGGDGGSEEMTEVETTESVVPETVVIGSDIPYRPFEYETEEGDLTGFDV